MNLTKQMHAKKQDMMRRYQRMIKERVVQSGYMQNVGYVNFVSLMVNNIKAKYPVRHKKCQQITDWQHFCGCLEQILFAFEEVKCNQTSLMDLEDLVAAEDHYNIIQQIHSSTSQITLFAGDPFIRIWRSNKKLNILNSKIYQELYINIKKKSKSFYGEHDFLQKVRLDPRYNRLNQITFNAHCIIDFVKLNIPMRFKQCKHIDCFDFTSILFQLEKINKNQNKQQQKMIKCGMNKFKEQCQSWCYPSYDQLAENLVLDEQLQQILREKHSSCYQIFYNMRTNQMMFSCPDEYEEYFDNLVENSICDEIIYQFTTLQMQELKLLEKKIQQQFINIINTKQRDENLQNYKYQNIQFKFKCPLAEQLNQEGDAGMIDYPGRCINCNQIQFADLQNLIQDYYIQQDSENKYYKCPLCQFNYNSGLNPDKIFRFDEKLKKFMIKFNSNIDENIKELYYNGEHKLLKYFQKNQRIEQQYKKNQFTHEIEYFRNLNCILNKSRLNNPLKIINCSNQIRVSFSSFYEKYQKSQYKLDKQNPLHLCSCDSCQEGLTDLSQLKFDDILHYILQQIPIQFQQLETHHIIYDYKSKSIKQIPNNDNLYHKSKNININLQLEVDNKKCEKQISKEQSEKPYEINQDQK